MIRVRLNYGRITNGVMNDPGDIIAVPEDEGKRMIAQGTAELIETEMVKPVENAALRSKGAMRSKHNATA